MAETPLLIDRPLLVYDGHCGFCRRFIPRWQALTGERVDYRPFLGEDQNPLPEVAPAALRRAVHLALPDGRRLAGAAAVAELGLYADDGLPVYHFFYRRVPGVAPLSNLAYRVVARTRPVWNLLARIFVGPDLRRPRQVLTRWLFLRLLGLIALLAVLSWWVQIDGLVGEDGISPAGEFLDAAKEYAAKEGWSDLELFHQVPTLAWAGASNGTLHELCALTALGATLLMLNVLPGIGVLLAWLGYLSLVNVGGVFMHFQWDALLLESLFAALFIVPWRGVRPGLARAWAPSWAGVWLMRALVFKLMFLSGVVKLNFNDPYWADMSALDFHYWTQPLPTWTSFYAHIAPEWTREVSIRVMYAIELGLPWLIFVGLRRLRYLAGIGIIALMLAIGLTGNYGYFNLLTATLALMLFDDGALLALVPRGLRVGLPDSQTFAHRRPGLGWRIPVAVLAIGLALVSLASFRVGIATDEDAAPELAQDIAAFVSPFELANSYGLFRTMTDERPEIEIEGSHDGLEWRHYRFSWKPGEALDAAPRFTGPHMPRLDWQMWFAAPQRDCRRVRWYLAFARRLLEGSRDVLGLLAEDPFPEGPPRYLRSKLWFYSFATAEEHAQNGSYWWREPADRDFCPTLELVHGQLKIAHLDVP